jgi:dihydroxyacetone kinase
MSTKKLINDPERVVDEALEGLLATNPGVSAVDNHRVVVRSDLDSLTGKVALICGGGSGHEPAFAGYVGKGMLSGAIAGSVFASPPPTSILAAILTVAERNPSGVLVVSFIISRPAKSCRLSQAG